MRAISQSPSAVEDSISSAEAPLTQKGDLQLRKVPLPLGLAVQMFSAFQGDKLTGESVAAAVLELAGADDAGSTSSANLTDETNVKTISSLLAGQGRMDEAEALLRQALVATRAERGSEDAQVLQLQTTLAQLLMDQGRMGDARRLFLASVEVQRRVLGAHHADTLTTLEQLASLLIEQDDLRFAEPLLCEAVALRRTELGDNHPTTLSVLVKLAALLQKQQRFAQAETLLRRTLAKQRELFGEAHIDTLATMGQLAQLLEAQNNVADSEALYVRVLVKSEALLGRSHHASLMAAYNYAGFLNNHGRMNDARPYLTRALAISGHVAASNNFFQAGISVRLGECLQGLQLYEAAERHLIAGYDALHDALGHTHPRTQRVLSDLISLYEAWGKPRKAAPFRAAHAACS